VRASILERARRVHVALLQATSGIDVPANTCGNKQTMLCIML